MCLGSRPDLLPWGLLQHLGVDVLETADAQFFFIFWKNGVSM